MNNQVIIDIIQRSFGEIYKEISGESPIAGQVQIGERSINMHDLVIVVGVTGRLIGRLIIDMPYNTSAQIAELVLQEKIKETDIELIESATGELANMWAGRAVSMLNEIGYQIKITPPTIFKGKNMTVMDKIANAILIPFQTNKGDVIINIVLNENEK